MDIADCTREGARALFLKIIFLFNATHRGARGGNMERSYYSWDSTVVVCAVRKQPQK